MLTRSLTFVLCLFAATKAIAQIKPGEKAPPLTITNWISNVPADSSLQDKLLVVDFWATWCKPCLAAVPHMNDLVRAHAADKNLQFVSISDEPAAKIRETLAKLPFATAVVSDTTHTSLNDYQVTAIPFCVLLDEQREVKWAGHAASLTEDMLLEFLRHQPVTPPKPLADVRAAATRYYDSLWSAYLKIIEDKSQTAYFQIQPLGNEAPGISGTHPVPGGFAVAVVNRELRLIVANALEVGLEQVALPDQLRDKFVTFCYRNTSQPGQRPMLEKLMQSLQLQYTESEETREVILLEVIDTALLYAHKPVNANSSSTNMAPNKLYIDNHPVAAMGKLLAEQYSMPAIVNEEKKYPVSINMEIGTLTWELMVQNMARYGVKVTKQKKQLPVYSFISIK